MNVRPLLRRGLRSSERGETLVEFAFASIVFFITLFGVLYYGQTVWRYNLTADLAQEGARWAAVRGPQAATPATEDGLSDFLTPRSVGMTLQPPDLKCGASAATLTDCDCEDVDADGHSTATACVSGNIIQVTVTTTFTPGTSIIPHRLLTLQAAAQMIIAH